MATTTPRKRTPKAVKAVVTVTKFTDAGNPFKVIRPAVSLAEFVPMHGGDYQATGYNTPLRDATARFVSHLESLKQKDRVVIGLMADESGSMSGNEAAVIQGVNDFVKGMAEVKKIDPKQAGTVLAVIATDGHENASKEISAEALQNLVAAKEKEGFTFIFLGAQIDAWNVGMGTVGLSGGITGQTISYRNTPAGTKAAFGNITTDSSVYLADSGQYAAQMSGQTMKSVTDTGFVTTSNINAQPGNTAVGTGVNIYVSPYSNVADALKKAKGEE